jgi:hypothetical protein
MSKARQKSFMPFNGNAKELFIMKKSCHLNAKDFIPGK